MLDPARVQKLQQTVEVAASVHQQTWFAMDSELEPSENLEEFIEGAKAAGQRDKSIGNLHHFGLALVHCFDNIQLGQMRMRSFR